MDLPLSFEGFRDDVHKAMSAFKAPGLAIAIVKDGRVVFSEGFGLRNVERNLPVTPNTLFSIGSITKGFTTMLMGILVDEGRLDWDKPVREYIPFFKLLDPLASERITPRDLVCHRSGLARHDLLWYGTRLTRKELVDRLGYLEPSDDFRTVFKYQNLMFITAGYLSGERAGCDWDELVRRRIFEPLGMASSSTSVTVSQQAADHALPYMQFEDGVRAIPFRNLDNAGPAGSINSNLTDMVQWIKLQMSKGRFGETQIVSETNLQQMHMPHTVVSAAADPLAIFQKYGEMSHSTCGLGWFVQAYRGRNVIHHGGSIDGFLAYISFMPQDDFGVIVLSNLHGTMLPLVITYNIYDRLLGLKPLPWVERIQEQVSLQRKQLTEDEKKMLACRVPGTRTSHALDDYLGVYSNPAYGSFVVTREAGGLAGSYGPSAFDLVHFHYDVFLGAISAPVEEPFLVTFHTDSKTGAIGCLSAPLSPPARPIVFTRVVP